MHILAVGHMSCKMINIKVAPREKMWGFLFVGGLFVLKIMLYNFKFSLGYMMT